MEEETRNHLGCLCVLETGVGSDASPVDLGLALHILDDGEEEIGLLVSELLAAITGLAGTGSLGSLGRHCLCLFGACGNEVMRDVLSRGVDGFAPSVVSVCGRPRSSVRGFDGEKYRNRCGRMTNRVETKQDSLYYSCRNVEGKRKVNDSSCGRGDGPAPRVCGGGWDE
ncbi:hypothetical protein VTI74DRAFT_10234 [Chaetomium olivicolor]